MAKPNFIEERLAEIKKDIIKAIMDELQISIKGYGSCRPAFMNIESKDVFLYGEDGTRYKVKYALCMSHLVVKDSINPSPIWVEYDMCDVTELNHVLNAIRELKETEDCEAKYMRAYNPLWLIGSDRLSFLNKEMSIPAEEYKEKYLA